MLRPGSEGDGVHAAVTLFCGPEAIGLCFRVMHLWSAVSRIGVLIGLFVAFAAGAAVIYKWTDADGVIHYSDQATPGAEKIITSSGTRSGSSAPRTSASPTAVAQGPAPSSLAFSQFAITSPAQDQVFFGDDPIPVQLVLQPGLQPNQTLSWHLNGRELEDLGPSALSFMLPKMARGSYALAAIVTDQVSGASQSTESVTFIVRQPSELSPQHKTP